MLENRRHKLELISTIAAVVIAVAGVVATVAVCYVACRITL